MVNYRLSKWIVITVFLGFWAVNPLFSKPGFVDVTLKSGEIVRFEFSSFQIDWVFPVTLAEENTCIKKVLQVEDIKDIYPISKSLNDCQNKEEWLFEVDLRDGSYIQGYVASQSKAAEQSEGQAKGHLISGTIYSTGTKRIIDYKEIREISLKTGE
jgi:hypothetical protein